MDLNTILATATLAADVAILWPIWGEYVPQAKREKQKRKLRSHILKLVSEGFVLLSLPPQSPPTNEATLSLIKEWKYGYHTWEQQVNQLPQPVIFKIWLHNETSVTYGAKFSHLEFYTALLLTLVALQHCAENIDGYVN